MDKKSRFFNDYLNSFLATAVPASKVDECHKGRRRRRTSLFFPPKVNKNYLMKKNDNLGFLFSRVLLHLTWNIGNNGAHWFKKKNNNKKEIINKRKCLWWSYFCGLQSRAEPSWVELRKACALFNGCGVNSINSRLATCVRLKLHTHTVIKWKGRRKMSNFSSCFLSFYVSLQQEEKKKQNFKVFLLWSTRGGGVRLRIRDDVRAELSSVKRIIKKWKKETRQHQRD